VVYQYVGRFEVAVHEAGIVCGREPTAGIEQDAEALLPRSLFGLEPTTKINAIDELHRDEDEPVMSANVVNRHHAGVA
jgi:hypothetical protein